MLLICRKKQSEVRKTRCCFGKANSFINYAAKVRNLKNRTYQVYDFSKRACTLLHWNRQLCSWKELSCHGDGYARTIPWRSILNLPEIIRPENYLTHINSNDTVDWKMSLVTNHPQRHQARQFPDWGHRLNSRYCVYHWFWSSEMLPEQQWWSYSLQRREEFDRYS